MRTNNQKTAEPVDRVLVDFDEPQPRPEPISRSGSISNPAAGRKTMKDTRTRSNWIKAAVVATLAVLTIIVVFQNTDVVHTTVLFGTVSMPHAVLLAVTFASGLLVGAVLVTRWRRRKQAG
jgi:uncharacterized integral membrane protein